MDKPSLPIGLPVGLPTGLPIGPDGVAALIPHAGAMRLIDTIEDVGAETIACTAHSHASPGNPLRTAGGLPASAAIEYAAQAMAAHAALSRGGPKRRGFLVVASGVEWSADRLDLAGPVLSIRAERLASTDNGAQYAFEVTDGASLKISGTLILSLEPESEG